MSQYELYQTPYFLHNHQHIYKFFFTVLIYLEDAIRLLNRFPSLNPDGPQKRDIARAPVTQARDRSPVRELSPSPSLGSKSSLFNNLPPALFPYPGPSSLGPLFKPLASRTPLENKPWVQKKEDGRPAVGSRDRSPIRDVSPQKWLTGSRSTAKLNDTSSMSFLLSESCLAPQHNLTSAASLTAVNSNRNPDRCLKKIRERCAKRLTAVFSTRDVQCELDYLSKEFTGDLWNQLDNLKR